MMYSKLLFNEDTLLKTDFFKHEPVFVNSLKQPEFEQQFYTLFNTSFLRQNKRLHAGTAIGCQEAGNTVNPYMRWETGEILEDHNFPYEKFFWETFFELHRLNAAEEQSLSYVHAFRFMKVPEMEYFFFRVWKRLFLCYKDYDRINNVISAFIFFVNSVMKKITPPAPGEQLRVRHQLTIQRAKEYIFEHFTRDIALEEVARYCYSSPYHFSRIFKRLTGYTLIQYLQILRLKHAEILIRSTGLSFKEIAFQSGYKRFDYFSAVFKKEFSVSPAHFRKLVRS